ncbi:MAG: hypothetical protein RLZZ408_292, partial [Verrucomicrobiota bacterium]
MKHPAFLLAALWAGLSTALVAQQPAANDASIQGISVGAQAPVEAGTNLPIGATNLPSSSDLSPTGASVIPELATNPPLTPEGLNAGTNS